jgi:hypothetical protein
MMQVQLKKRSLLLISYLVLLLTSCSTVRLISEYDDVTDKAVTVLQEKVTKFFVKMENQVGTPQADYTNYKTFYEDAKVDLNTLKIRADAIDKNKIVQDQIAELYKMIENLEKLHKLGFASAELLKPLQQPFNSAFTAIIKLQLALKRGEKNN